MLVFYPKDFTFVCPTELRAFSARVEEFKAIGCDVMAISTDTAESHLAWVTMPVELGGLGTVANGLLVGSTGTAYQQLVWCGVVWCGVCARVVASGKMNIPIVADVSKAISATYGVLLEDAGIALRGAWWTRAAATSCLDLQCA